ncbi:hypothetical protein SAY86_018728 [Trapa natans]|uniref:Transcription repressor n=1 Tax=Trapa natans TaxID=22666 RepID=A0AAN7LNE6_TRANT|nr:hypothetical protein SAY86_018728 [Trapa natans]
MKLPIPHFRFMSKNTEEDTENTAISPSLWPWPYYCHLPRTLSFRTATKDVDPETEAETEAPESVDDSRVVEMAVCCLKSSERLFFKPGETSSILEELKRDCGLPLVKESLVVSMESQDPYADFRESMEEMVKAYGMKEWEGLKGLLDWYLRVNGRANHGYILGAFVDLLVSIQVEEAISSNPSSSTINHHHDYCSSLISPSLLSLCTSASSSSSWNSLSMASVFPCLSFGAADD